MFLKKAISEVINMAFSSSKKSRTITGTPVKNKFTRLNTESQKLSHKENIMETIEEMQDNVMSPRDNFEFSNEV